MHGYIPNRQIHDSSLGSSGDDDFLGVLRGPSSFANAFLYVGLGTVAIGLVIAFVGTGEKGFKTVELRLIGPSLIGNCLVWCVGVRLACVSGPVLCYYVAPMFYAFTHMYKYICRTTMQVRLRVPSV